MEKRIRVHVGAGDKYWPGFINCDAHGDQDFIWNVEDTEKYPDLKADEIHAIHLFEHLPRLKVVDILKVWLQVLKPGGKLIMEMPCLDKIAKLITEGEQNTRLTLLGIFGDPRDPKPGMMHQWSWQEWELKQVLEEAGFVDVEFMEPHFHIPKRDFRVECKRGK